MRTSDSGMLFRNVVAMLLLLLISVGLDVRNVRCCTAGPVESNRLNVRLNPVFHDIAGITELVFYPGSSDQLFVLQKNGTLLWLDLTSKKKTELHRFPVLTSSEQGLLGLALSPSFQSTGILYIHYSIEKNEKRIGRISEWTMKSLSRPGPGQLGNERVLLEVEQPYANHNGGKIEIGPDGYLYIALGDGGSRADPLKNGQNSRTLLGSILRISPRPGGKSPYSIPPDNPQGRWAPEIFAIGLRNPWKFSFSPDGRLIAADVGQDDFEEISIIQKGGNYGWNIREGFHCFDPPRNCISRGLSDPIYEYSHDVGKSITGGFVYTGQKIPALRGKYVFGDFIGGWIRAINLPARHSGSKYNPDPVLLGKWPILISTFGRDASGEIYVADFGQGVIYRME